MTDEQFKQPTEPQAATTQEELTASTPVEETAGAESPGGESPGEQATGEQQAEGARARQHAADDFRDSLSNLSSAIDRFGKAAEARARLELEQGRPEINRTVEEMKRGLDGLIRKSGGLLDKLSGRLAKDEGASAKPEQGAATHYHHETESSAPDADAEMPGHGEVSENQHSSPVDFPPPISGEPTTTASQAMSTEPDVAPAPPKEADSHS